MTKLLKESIAEAKTIREMALKQAKAFLEEAFAPQVKSMISRKIQQEMEDEEEKELEEPVEEEVTNDAGAQIGTDDDHEKAEEDSGLTEQEDTSDIGTGDNKEPSKESSETTTDDEEGATKVKSDHEDAKESELTEQDEPEDDEAPEEDDLDLEQVVAELEAEAGEEDEPLEEPVVDEDDDLDFDVEDDEEEVPEEPVGEAEEVPAADDDEELDIDIEEDEEVPEEEPVGEAEEEVPAEVPEEEDDDEDEVDNFVGEAKIKSLRTELAKTKNKLAKAIEVVRFMKSKLNEINVLNAKLLFTNKVFRNFALDNKSKMKVVENFDRAKSIREIKLVYATLMENLGSGESPNRTQRIVEGASRSVGTTKPKVDDPIVNANADMKSRIHKLANIKLKK